MTKLFRRFFVLALLVAPAFAPSPARAGCSDYHYPVCVNCCEDNFEQCAEYCTGGFRPYCLNTCILWWEECQSGCIYDPLLGASQDPFQLLTPTSSTQRLTC